MCRAIILAMRPLARVVWARVGGLVGFICCHQPMPIRPRRAR